MGFCFIIVVPKHLNTFFTDRLDISTSFVPSCLGIKVTSRINVGRPLLSNGSFLRSHYLVTATVYLLSGRCIAPGVTI
jgi:hypothetical protein